MKKLPQNRKLYFYEKCVFFLSIFLKNSPLTKSFTSFMRQATLSLLLSPC